MTRTSVRNLTFVLLGLWLALAVGFGATGVFDSGVTTGGRAPLPLGLAVITPLLLFLVWFAASATFREFVLSLNPRALTLAQTWRIGGFVFLALAARGVLPHTFANIAGWGDIFIGATAAFATYRFVAPHHRSLTIAWQALGMLDLVTAIALGVLSSPTAIGILAEGPVTTRVMGLLPMSLIPTFAVPLLFIFHIIVIAQAQRWATIGGLATARA